ncbi:MAG: cytochrome c oxidase subunit 3 [SAR116 cluster bacterium]|nr:MAG: cytochrome c oxidase subunit 3 [SAR116 cluster bacterium]HBQ22508.1 cytochrome c oxidase subunit 3 [Alphaproteobacteria bacterium]|tara:strand:- start:4860 stop:5693 length:834 start_codon:yes stop_codon:yes gene_type:complete
MADAHAKKHDYHLVNPSPWPFVGSVSAFVMAVGLVFWLHEEIGPYLAVAGFLGVLFTMFGWWRDVVSESRGGDHTPVVNIHLRYGIALFIASEALFFVAWFWAYFDASLFTGDVKQYLRVEHTGGVWPPEGIQTFNPWHLPLVNTVILLLSGVTVTWAHHAVMHDERKGLIMGLALTVGLGAVFSVFQAIEYAEAAFAFSENIYGATFYMATGFHGFHVIVGTLFLLVCLIRANQGDFTADKHNGLEAAAWYWHFVDVVWLFLFAAVYVWGAGTNTH